MVWMAPDFVVQVYLLAHQPHLNGPQIIRRVSQGLAKEEKRFSRHHTRLHGEFIVPKTAIHTIGKVVTACGVIVSVIRGETQSILTYM